MPFFAGHCNHCRIYGHKGADCRPKEEPKPPPGTKEREEELARAQQKIRSAALATAAVAFGKNGAPYEFDSRPSWRAGRADAPGGTGGA
ncbi:hypothetical protein NKR19_g1679 [Coniochaeta hoffmannii]|uniref:Uncharacterized protein n=1 Tax=Coniochaeta hoffmannii TaxID=91930 RepID=A0AA38VNT8_9PEZI|nr:hypothetical protein NKR19_g1679 [Coniochaeta hoffmannii]